MTAASLSRTGASSGMARRCAFALFLLAICAITLFPFLFMMWRSFGISLASLHGSTTLWSQVFQALPVGTYMLHSALLAVSTTIAVALCGSMAGYAVAKLHFPGSRAAYIMTIACLIIPFPTILLPEYVNASRFGLLSGFGGAFLVLVGTGLPFAVILMKNYFESMPDELFDSAAVDGTSTMGAFTRIFLPLSIPGLAVVVVLNFTTVWNDLLVSLLFIPNTNDRTIGVGLAALAGVHNTNNDVLLTASLISTLPTVLVYVFFQRFLVSGILSGMAK